MEKSNTSANKKPWLAWAMELQFIAQAGITYSKDPFDLERFQRIRDISAEIMQAKSGWNLEKVKDVFCNETGFQTPKLDTRAAIFRKNKILLVQEKNKTWSLPGGWVDVNESIRSNTVKEVQEESGYTVKPLHLIAVQDRSKHNQPAYAYGICKVFVHCEILGENAEFIPNHETLKRGFFPLDALPPLATEKNTEAQIRLCFQAHGADYWETVFD